MQKVALLTEYDGSAFHGWQQQQNALSVQAALQEGWLTLTQEKVSLTGSSRTDAGVNARGHVCHFETEARIPLEKIPLALNAVLPEGVSVRRAQSVPNDFDSRHQSTGKAYVYRFQITPYRPALERRWVCHCPVAPDLKKMADLAHKLEGQHDFEAMMDQGSVVRRTLREIDAICCLPTERGFNLVCLGRGFLYHQVRILAGTLYAVGCDRLSEETVFQGLETKQRPLLGKTMPPQGLCLERVFYPQPVFGGDGEEDYQKWVDGLHNNPPEFCNFLVS